MYQLFPRSLGLPEFIAIGMVLLWLLLRVQLFWRPREANRHAVAENLPLPPDERALDLCLPDATPDIQEGPKR